MRLNTAARPSAFTHEGAPATAYAPRDALRRAVLSCLLWEDQFYEPGVSIADRIVELARERPPAEVAALAVEARSKFHLRHVPLLLLSVLERTGPAVVADAIFAVIQRADEMGEFLAIHAKVNGVTPDKVKPKISHQMKRGLARTFRKFDAYQLGKYNRDSAVKLKDVLRLVHPKPENDGQAALWKRVIDGTLEAPDTWEVALSRGADKRETFTRLLEDRKLGYMALLRNLRGMVSAGVEHELIRSAILARRGGAERVFPFRYVAAARACPQMEPVLDVALVAAVEEMPRLEGPTVVLVDVSGSMEDKLSAKSDMTRMDAAAALASVIPAPNRRVFTFSERLVEVPPRHGMAGVDAVVRSQSHYGTALGSALHELNGSVHYERIIVITDEQFSARPSGIPAPKCRRAYMVNVAAYQNGVGYGNWISINGWSDSVVRFITELEADAS